MPSWLGATGSEHSSCQKVECPDADPHSRGRAHRLAPHSLGLAALEPGERTYRDRLPSQDLPGPVSWPKAQNPVPKPT